MKNMNIATSTKITANINASAKIAEQTAIFLAKQGNAIEIIPSVKVKILYPVR